MINTAVRLRSHDWDHTRVDLWVNNGKATNGPITVRNSELVEFILLLKPSKIEVDMEEINSNVFHRINSLKALHWI